MYTTVRHRSKTPWQVRYLSDPMPSLWSQTHRMTSSRKSKEQTNADALFHSSLKFLLWHIANKLFSSKHANSYSRAIMNGLDIEYNVVNIKYVTYVCTSMRVKTMQFKYYLNYFV